MKAKGLGGVSDLAIASASDLTDGPHKCGLRADLAGAADGYYDKHC